MEKMEELLTSEQINKDVYKSRIPHKEIKDSEDAMREREYDIVRVINSLPIDDPETKKHVNRAKSNIRYLMDYGVEFLDKPLIQGKYDFELARRN
jgi:hypothetical protein